MARTVRDANLETRAARLRLKPRAEPYWRSIDPGAHLGYYRGSRGGTWVARVYADARYRKTSLGTADDSTDADGVGVLSFVQAQAAARAWFAQEARRAGGLPDPIQGPYRVRDAVRDYLAWYSRHRKALAATELAAEAHILPTLGEIEVRKLTTNRLRDWHEELAAAPVRKRIGRVKSKKISDPCPRESESRETKTDPEAMRKRRATANRVLTVLKAALNLSWRESKVPSDDSWRRVKPFHDVDAPVVRYLTEAECLRLVNATQADFRPMVRAALLSGCRYGELVMLRVADLNLDAGTLAIRTSKSGKSRHVILTEEGRALFVGAAVGKASSDLIFTRPDGAPWGKSHQQRPLSSACEGARISPAVSFHVLRHTHGSLLAMKGVPMAVIARQLGHADERMTQRHYAHLAPSYVADTIRAHFPSLGIVEPTNIHVIG